ncbi:MAG: O-antigen ligase family protein [Planctomycetaceae bacterium]|nr:O-antigen ligase family protein [Planctomycetaceae bacterium]
MIPIETAWWGALVLIVSIWAIVLRRSGPYVAFGVAIVLSFLAPGWIEMEFLGLPFDVRLSVAIVALTGYGLHPDSRIWTPLTLPDLVIAAMMTLHIVSDLVVEGFSWSILLRAYGEWTLPFYAGRYAVRNQQELRKIAPWVMVVLGLLSVEAIIEVLTGINLWEVLFARKAGDFVPDLGRRWGFMRASGTAINPIFYAMILLLLLPWVSVTYSNPQSRGRRWKAAIVTILSVLGMCATISRGPIAGLIIAIASYGVIRWRPLRWIVATLLTVTVICSVIWPKEVLDLTRMGVQDQHRNQEVVELDGEELEYSGSLTRILLFRAYSRALRNAGFLGYGTEAVRDFPPNIPHLPRKSEAIYLMRHVDNAYVLIGLRFGWLGIATFCLLPLTTFWTAIVLAQTSDLRGVCTWYAAVMAGAAAVLLTVYFAHDFGFVFLWSCGIVSGLATAAVQSRRGESPSA